LQVLTIIAARNTYVAAPREGEAQAFMQPRFGFVKLLTVLPSP